MNKKLKLFTVVVSVLTSFAVSADSRVEDIPSITPRAMADALHMVIDSNRIVYTKAIVNRLVKEEKVIKVSEHFGDEKALALPAQLFRIGAELVDEQLEARSDINFSYSLRSLWPVRKKNAPQTKTVEAGLTYVAEHKGKNYYAEETLEGQRYLTAVYADTAVASVCVSCHNTHKHSPRRNFVLGDVMGGVVIRVRLEN